MKLALLAFTLSLLSFAHAAPSWSPMPSTPDPLGPDNTLPALRTQLEIYESPIISAYLSRHALFGAIPKETDFLFNVTNFTRTIFPPPRWASDEFSQPVLPVATNSTPPLDDEEKGNKTTIFDFVSNNLIQWSNSEGYPLNPAATVVLDANLLQLISARILLGYSVALAKFQDSKETFCKLLATDGPDRKAIWQQLTNKTQEAIVLHRVQQKSTNLHPNFLNGGGKNDVTNQVVELFEKYIIPLTTQLEQDIIISKAPDCNTKPQSQSQQLKQ